MLNSCLFSLPPSTSQPLEVDPATQCPSLGMPLAHPLAHLPLPLAAPTPCTAEALQCCCAMTPSHHIISHHITSLHCPAARAMNNPPAVMLPKAKRFLLLPSPCCITQATEKVLLTEGLFLWLQPEPKPAVPLVSTMQATHQCEQPLMGLQPLGENRALLLETCLVSLEWFCAGNHLELCSA